MFQANKRVQASPCESKDLQKFVQKPDCYLLEDAWPGHPVLKLKQKLCLLKMYQLNIYKRAYGSLHP